MMGLVKVGISELPPLLELKVMSLRMRSYN